MSFRIGGSAGDIIRGVGRAIDHGADVIRDLAGDQQEKFNEIAGSLAVAYKEERGESGDFNDCVVVVAAGCAAAGASYGGPVGAALGAGAGVPAARLACRRVFPE